MEKSTIKALFTASGAALGRLNNDQFEIFIDKLSDKLDLEEDGEEEEEIDEGDDADSEDEDGNVEEGIYLDDSDSGSGSGIEGGGEDEDAYLQDGKVIIDDIDGDGPMQDSDDSATATATSSGSGSSRGSSGNGYVKNSIMFDMMSSAFKALLRKGKDTSNLADVLKSDFVKAIITSSNLNERDVADVCSRVTEELSLAQFQDFIVELASVRKQPAIRPVIMM